MSLALETGKYCTQAITQIFNQSSLFMNYGLAALVEVYKTAL
jgi:hypothetical protein